MKKLLFVGLVASTAWAAFGQGMIEFQNLHSSPFVNAPIYFDVVGGGALSGAGYRAVLLGGTTAASPYEVDVLGSQWPPYAWSIRGGTGMSLLASPSGATWATFKTGAYAGYVAIGVDPLRVVPNVPWGGTGRFQVAAWAGDYPDWDSAVAAALSDNTVHLGVSNPVDVTLPTGPFDINFSYLVGLASFSISYVPEPGMASLLVCGLGVWLWRNWGQPLCGASNIHPAKSGILKKRSAHN